MKCDYENGFAFILEGDTEKEFYLSLLEYLANKHNFIMERQVNNDNPDVSYTIKKGRKCFLVKFKVMNTISQVPRAGDWFKSQCMNRHQEITSWYVFLCYDTDDYKNDITKFHEGDWQKLRSALNSAKRVIDIAATADIEDVMLIDLQGICTYLQCSVPQLLEGKKGKAKLKKLFRFHGSAYHEGVRARGLIDTLDMQKIIDSNIVPLNEIENQIFG